MAVVRAPGTKNFKNCTLDSEQKIRFAHLSCWFVHPKETLIDGDAYDILRLPSTEVSPAFIQNVHNWPLNMHNLHKMHNPKKLQVI